MLSKVSRRRERGEGGRREGRAREASSSHPCHMNFRRSELIFYRKSFQR
jgi:hypothetical protein